MKTRPTINAGTTLVELMIAVALLGIVSLGMVGVFSSISKGIQFSKARTLASNLAQEQMQILKQKSFNRVLVTTAPAYLTDWSPDIPYDTGYYPPESILEGSVSFVRYTYIQVVDENSGNLVYFTGVPDTGMKAITVTVTWYQGTERKKLQVRNILSNIETTQGLRSFAEKYHLQPTRRLEFPGRL